MYDPDSLLEIARYLDGYKKEMTPQEIFEYKRKWSPGYSVEIHSDLESDCIQWCKTNCDRKDWNWEKHSDVYYHKFSFCGESDCLRFSEKFKRGRKQ